MDISILTERSTGQCQYGMQTVILKVRRLGTQSDKTFPYRKMTLGFLGRYLWRELPGKVFESLASGTEFLKKMIYFLGNGMNTLEDMAGAPGSEITLQAQDIVS
jgi:hypothetical protein